MPEWKWISHRQAEGDVFCCDLPEETVELDLLVIENRAFMVLLAAALALNPADEPLTKPKQDPQGINNNWLRSRPSHGC